MSSVIIPPVVERRTDDRGIYRIFGLAPGTYVVGISARQPSTTRGVNAVAHQQTFAPREANEATARRVELAAGDVVEDVDISVLPYGPTFVARGRVVDEDGKPLTGVTVFASPDESAGYSGGLTSGSPAPANEKGEFGIADLRPGRYIATAGGNRDENLFCDPLPFEVTDADVAGLEVRVSRASSVSGVVIVDGGDGVPARSSNVMVDADDAFQGPWPPNRPFNGSHARMNDDGSFRLQGLRPGPIRFRLAGYGEPRVTLLRAEMPGRGTIKTLDVGSAEDVTGLRLVVVIASGSVRGTLRFDGFQPSPTAQFGVALVSQAADGDPNAAIPSAQVDARGRFLIEHVAPGVYKARGVAYSGPDMPPQGYEGDEVMVTVPASGTAEISLTVRLGRTREESAP